MAKWAEEEVAEDTTAAQIDEQLRRVRVERVRLDWEAARALVQPGPAVSARTRLLIGGKLRERAGTTRDW